MFLKEITSGRPSLQLRKHGKCTAGNSPGKEFSEEQFTRGEPDVEHLPCGKSSKRAHMEPFKCKQQFKSMKLENL